MAEYAILFDSSMCGACKGCQIMCKQWNMLPASLDVHDPQNGKILYPFTGTYQDPADLNGDTRLIIEFNETEGGPNGVEWAFTRRACYHCSEPACKEVCPVEAISQSAEGIVQIDPDKCIGCKYCNEACPFLVPKYRQQIGVSNKCTLCSDRVGQGRAPACVQTCPGGALHFGDRAEMISQAKERVEYLKGRGFEKAEVWGETQMGGLHVIEVAKYGIEAHGLPKDPKKPTAVTAMGWLKPLTGIGVAAVLGGLGVSFLTGIGYKPEGDAEEAPAAKGDEQ